MKRRIKLLTAILTVALLASAAFASPTITLSEFESLFPDYVNHEQQNGFTPPCVDATGKMTVNVNVNDILGTVTEPIAVAMACQSQAFGNFNAAGPVAFSDPGVQLLNFGTLPGHPDAFFLEFIVPQGSGVFDICIENTGWPEGCVPDLVDLAAWDLQSVDVTVISISRVKATY